MCFKAEHDKGYVHTWYSFSTETSTLPATILSHLAEHF